MKKLLLFLSLSLWCTVFSFAQTLVSGGIFDAVTWTTTQSPYIVTGDVVVFPDGSLTIEPGVEIRFKSNTILELREGDLFANGTASNPITFTLDSASTTIDKWEGIKNTTTTNAAIVVELNHAIIEYAKTGLDYGKGSSYRYIDNTIFRYNDRGVYDGGLGYNWVTISNSEFLDNGVGMEGRMSAVNCTFTNNETGFGNPHTFANITEGGRVLDCTFSNNQLGVGSIGQIIVIAIIENSYFYDNDKSFWGYWANVDSSYFYNSTEVGIAAFKGEIQNSLFSQNALGIEAQINNLDLSVHDNFFESNVVGLQVSGPNVEVVENTFCNNTDKAVVLTTNQAVTLNYNCWCSTNLTDIGDMIVDAYDDVSLGIATYNLLSNNCLLGLVYPGDADDNSSVDASDILQIGLTFGMTGDPRNNASTNWMGQECNDWSTVLPNNVNAKHADTNGDGIVNADDVAAIALNYGASHFYQSSHQAIVDSSVSYTLSLETPDTFVVGQTVQVDVMLGEITQPVNDLYGISFAIEADDSFFEGTSFSFINSNSWLGSNNEILHITKEFQSEGRVEVGIVRNDAQPASGYGKVASFQFVVSEDIIIMVNETENLNTLFLNIVDIQMISSQGVRLAVESENAEVFLTSNNETSNIVDAAISIFPNPVEKELFLSYKNLEVESLQLRDVMGRNIRNYMSNQMQLSFENIEQGIYFLEIQTKQGRSIKKIVVER